MVLASALLLSPASAMLHAIHRHVNPFTVEEENNLPDVVSFYSYVALAIKGLNFTKARSLVINVSSFYLPSNVRYIISKFNEVLNETLSALDECKDHIDRAEDLLASSDYSGALKEVGEAKRSLAEAVMLYPSLDEVSRSLRILPVVENVGHVIKELGDRIKELEETIRTRMYLRTRVTLNVTPSEVLYGSYITVYGNLTDSSGEPLPGREVKVHIGDKVVSVVTNKRGEYRLRYRVSSYTEEVSVYSEFVPRGSDSLMYSYSRSDTVKVRVLFMIPYLSADVSPRRLRPGDVLYVRVSTDPGVEVAVLTPFGSARGVASNTTMDFYFKVPLDAPEGSYTIYVRTVPKGVMGPASWSGSIYVYREPDVPVVEAPDHILTGFTYRVTVLVPVNSSLEVWALGAQVRVIGNEVKVYVPHSYLGQYIDLHVKAIPLDPTFKPYTVTVRIRVYNTVAVLAALVMAVAVAAGALSHVLRRPRILPEERRRAGAEIGEERRRGSWIDQLLSAIEGLTGVRFRRSYTYREYLREVGRRISSSAAVKVLEDLFRRLEAVVYGGPKYRRLAEEVRELGRRVIGLLRRILGGEG